MEPGRRGDAPPAPPSKAMVVGSASHGEQGDVVRTA